MSARRAQPKIPATGHGAAELPSVRVDSYNVELRDAEGFVGDRASKGAFQALLETWRERVAETDEDPLGEAPTDELGKKKLEKVLLAGDIEAAGVVQSAIEDFANELAAVIRRFLRLKAWQDTERIVIGGGFREGRIGELALGRTAVLLKAEGIEVPLVPIGHDPDEAGLIGAVHLAPSWIFAGHGGILAVDIGGTNIRAGIVELGGKEDLSDARVIGAEHWRHGDEGPTRNEAVDRLLEMLKTLVERAGKRKLKLAPFVGIGCPGVIREDGSIARGSQNLPGNWAAKGFNLAELVAESIPAIDGHEPAVVLHNDAVVQGLSQRPFMRDVERWGVLTIGTGLGNARFTNREVDDE
jgi:predicted NBD/HSP70 family sugar kinase